MDFRLSQEEERFRQQVRQFIRKELLPHWTETGLLQKVKDEEEKFSRSMMHTPIGLLSHI